jgi:predicted transcriptional regulator
VLSHCPGTGYRSGMPTIRKTPQRTFAIDDEIWKKVSRIAKIRRETMSDVMRRAVVDYFEKHKHLLDDD